MGGEVLQGWPAACRCASRRADESEHSDRMSAHVLRPATPAAAAAISAAAISAAINTGQARPVNRRTSAHLALLLHLQPLLHRKLLHLSGELTVALDLLLEPAAGERVQLGPVLGGQSAWRPPGHLLLEPAFRWLAARLGDSWPRALRRQAATPWQQVSTAARGRSPRTSCGR